VSIGTANFFNPYATVEVAEGIEKFLDERNIADIHEIIGCVK
jgi:dihydroorotate dehydrogenase (NAD+) catalytic subunit